MNLNLEQVADELGEAPGQRQTTQPKSTPLSALVRHHADDPNELLRHRYLCRGGGLLLVGSTGIGKSSLAMQAMILWAIGKPLFGIQPVKPLKSLLIQAENDEGDLAEMRDGATSGLSLTGDEIRSAQEKILVTREDEKTGSSFCTSVIKPLLEKHRPDLLWIDPALAYLGGESISQKDVGAFLRNMLNPLLRASNCSAVLVHHTNKPPRGRDKTDWSAGDFAYAGGGSAEWANWPRAVLALRSLGSHDVFELHAAKRGGRLGWKELDGTTTALTKVITHSTKCGNFCWREAEASEILKAAKGKKLPCNEDIMRHVPAKGTIEKAALQRKVNGEGIGFNRINPMIEDLLKEGTLHQWNQPRSGTNPRKLLSRAPQPEVAPATTIKVVPKNRQTKQQDQMSAKDS